MKSSLWKVFHDANGWYLATVKGKPSCRMAGKPEAQAEAARRNLRVASYERAVLEGNAGRLPSPFNR
jgi:hypothetical protein